jgi:predicted SnoaL-like aldol condensation-catalyzing enzyme
MATTPWGTTEMTRKQQVVALLKSIETGDRGPVAVINPNKYIQHNLGAADGLATMKYDRIHKVLGEGNFVLVVSEGSFGGVPTSFYDLFRIENEKLAEHWDTIEAIPDRSAWKNEKGKFGF